MTFFIFDLPQFRNQQETTMPTFFETAKRNFKDVTIGSNNEIDTTEFLEASESVVCLFGTC